MHKTIVCELNNSIEGKHFLSTSSLISSSFQGGPTIFHNGFYRALLSLECSPLSLFVAIFSLFFPSPSACTHCKPSGVQVRMHTVEGKKEKKLPQVKREGIIQGIGGLCKKL